MFDHWYAMDFGGTTCRFFDFVKEETVSFPACIATKDDQIVAIGKEALSHAYTDTIKYPFDHGQLYTSITPLVKSGLEQLGASHSLLHPSALVVVPTDATDDQLDVWQTQILAAGIQKISFLNVMDALQTEEPTMIVHAGHTYTEIGIYAHQQQFTHQTVYFAGKQIEEAIMQDIQKKYGCFITVEDAHALKEAASNALWKGKNARLRCNAKNAQGQYGLIEVRALDLWPCMKGVIDQIMLWSKQCLEKVSVDLKESIHENGILLSGGLARCFGLRQTLEQALNDPVIVTKTPEMDLLENMKGWK